MKTLFIALAVFILVVLVGVIYLLIKAKNATPQGFESKPHTLEDLIRLAKSASTSELDALASEFLNTQPFPKRNDASLPKGAKERLDFVRAFTSNLNANAKQISSLNTELCKRFPTYKADIDEAVQTGVSLHKK